MSSPLSQVPAQRLRQGRKSVHRRKAGEDDMPRCEFQLELRDEFDLALGPDSRPGEPGDVVDTNADQHGVEWLR
jgi:hypothetical protein